MTPPTALPLVKAAFDHPPTMTGHRRLVIKRRIWLIGVLFLGAALVYLGVTYPPSDIIGSVLFSLLFYPLALTVAFLALRRTRRVARILKAYPWQAYSCEYPRRSLDSPKVIMIKFTEEHTPVLRFTPFSVHLAQKQNPQPDMIWFAGDPRYGGVVSPVGGHFPVRVVPEAMGEAVPDGTPADDARAELADLVKDGRVHTT
ncbi:hypothetical protein OG883_12005 [Streptomyces sp. NBC_01142]|uniref:hypothetical protein n=1 Tax=Streptomyces sp. NBC_01142 TaxID=2975865 RepID=UPI002257D410|nr:hypothetical protein [Streptomyces sp. NBC_01142]MCX4820622.1 hypothetical protein [Streptomyces sp. NBC_01142]